MFFMPLAAINNRISSLYSGSTLSKRFSSCVIHSAERSFSFMTGSLLILSDKLFCASSPAERAAEVSETVAVSWKEVPVSSALSKNPGSSVLSKESKPQSPKSASKSVVSVCATSEVLEGVIKTGTLSSGKSGCKWD